MKRFRVFIASFAALCCLSAPATPVLAATNVFDGACDAPGSSSSTACQQNGRDPLTGPNGLITNVTKIIAYLSGVAAIIMIIISGFMFVTSDGDSGKVASARQTLIYAVVGIVIALVAQGIVVFVLSRI